MKEVILFFLLKKKFIESEFISTKVMVLLGHVICCAMGFVIKHASIFPF